MNRVQRMKCYYKVLALLLVVVCCPDVACCGASERDALFSSSAFADPAETVSMTPEWKIQRLQHPEEVDADLFAVLSHQMFDVWKEWIDQFAMEKQVTIQIRSGVDGASAGALRRKEADITCYCGSPKSSDRMPGINFHTIGVVPVAIFVNANNTINNLSLEDLMKIFRGEVTNWAELGGEKLNIVPVARSHCKKRHGRWRPLDDMQNLSPAAIKVGSIEDAVSYVAERPGGISYEILPRVEPQVKQGLVRVLSLDTVNPYDLGALSKGAYPLYRAYTFTTWSGTGLENPLAVDVIKLLRDKTAEHASVLSFVPVGDLRKNGWSFHGEELVGEP